MSTFRRSYQFLSMIFSNAAKFLGEVQGYLGLGKIVPSWAGMPEPV